MAQWTVDGADKKTGRETTLLVEAPSEALAREAAVGRGIVVAGVTPMSPAVPLEYRSPATAAPPGGMRALKFASRVLLGIAFITYLISLIGVFGVVVAANQSGGGLAYVVLNLVRNFASPLSTLLWGAAVHVASALLLVLRDYLAGRQGQAG